MTPWGNITEKTGTIDTPFGYRGKYGYTYDKETGLYFLKLRKPEYLRIVSDPKICSGKPCIKGTRIPVHMILDLLAAGEDFEGIKKAYPNITDEDIRACLAYASILADEEAGDRGRDVPANLQILYSRQTVANRTNRDVAPHAPQSKILPLTTDSTGTVAATFKYDDWRNLLSKTGEVDTPFSLFKKPGHRYT